MSLIDRQRELAGYLIAGFPEFGLKGWSIKGACASVGNGTQENLCEPVTHGRFDHGSDGIYQWRLGRLDELKSWTASNGLDWTAIKAQAAFHMFEMTRDYVALNDQLLDGAKSLETLTANFCDVYERPAAWAAELDARIKFARDVYSIMQNTAPAVPQAPAIATGTAGAVMIGIGSAIHYLQGTPEGSVLSLVITGAILLMTCLLISGRKTARPAALPGEDPLPPSEPKPFDKLPPAERLRILLGERAQIDAQILNLEESVKASIASMNGLLGQIHPVVMAPPPAASQQVIKQGE